MVSLRIAAFMFFTMASAFAADNQLAPYTTRAEATLASPAFQQAAAHLDANKEAILKEWITLTEINAPSNHEQERAKFVERLLQQVKVEDIRFDSVGNLMALRKGTAPGPAIVVDAHLDTVFQPGQKIKAEIKDGWIYAPGVCDDTRNIEAMLAILRAMDHANIKTKRDILFVFTVREETDFGGANHFVPENKPRIAQYLALDGGYEGFMIGGTAFKSSRFHFLGPGGHTKSDTPPHSAVLPLSRAIARIYKLKIPKEPATFMNIGMLGGAAVPNAKAADAWFSMDLRSTSDKVALDLDKKIIRIAEEEARRAGMKLRVDADPFEPAAQLPGHRNSPLVLSAEALHRAMEFKTEIGDSGSNHANVAILKGIPAISTGVSPCRATHSLAESAEIEPFYRGTKKVLALLLMLAEVQ
jgi:tripeptide aminopeptidase